MDSRYVRMIASGLLLFILPGCWNRIELNDLMLITGVGVDKSLKKEIRLCTQTFVPKTTSQKQNAQANTIERCEDGSSIADALSKLQLKYSRKLFWSHSSALVISKQFAQSNGVQEVADFMVRFPEVWYRERLFISKGSAESILAWRSPVENSTAEVLREMAKSRRLLEMDLLHYSQMIKDDAQTAVLPIIDLKQAGEKSSDKTIAIVGTAVFNKDHMVGELDAGLTRGLLWFRNEIREATFTMKPEKEKGDLSLFIIHAHTELKPRIEGGKWKMTVKVESDDDIVHNETSLDTSDPEVIKRLERESEAILRKRLEKTVIRVQRDFNTDVLGYAEAFNKKYPQAWKQKKDQWGSQFRQIETDYDIQVNILRPGEYAPPAGVRKD